MPYSRTAKPPPILQPLISAADVMHIRGAWEPVPYTAAGPARQCKVPYIVRPAGMLDPWSLAQKPWKKRVALMMGFRKMIDRAAFLHALNRDERDLVGLLGLQCPVEVIPNGVFLESLEGAPTPG